MNHFSVPRPTSSDEILRSERFLSPPRSDDSSECHPFKAETADLISLTMKKGQGHGHGWHNPFSADLQPIDRTATTRLTLDGPRSRRRSGTYIAPSLRKTVSLPAVEFQRYSLQSELRARSILRSRRWSIPSKAPSTRALVTIAPVPETRGAVSQKPNTAQTPAMITLRRATTAGSPKRMSLTFFPTPRFSRRYTGFLSYFLTTFSSKGERRSSPTEILQVMGSKTDTPPAPSIEDNEARPSTSSVALPIFTELTPMPAPSSPSGQPMEAFNSMRRCSTRYVSNNIVYEIIWGEDGYNAISKDCIPSSVGRDTGVEGEVSVDTGPLKRRLSKVLTQSTSSSALQTSRRTSWWPGSETFPGLLPLMESPKLAKIAREVAFRDLPQSQSSKKPVIPSTLATDLDGDQQLFVEPTTTQAGNIFPPSNKDQNEIDPLLNLAEEPDGALTVSGSSNWSVRGDEASLITGPRSRFGSMVGASSHQKRPQTLAETDLPSRERKQSV
ncbi:hypothetical protein PV08_00103 [Exophiala spinifera]|uniref:Uncharacterized protein n=1 Tax=Exophiala spinifera TaxID=91928 RepID=A0A0D1YWA1_9EURO|nr:uncharacterized protein PV08_00103 [Exophiala spinifera]KIW19531.1 hypothetical protein PV08_00103 [Exophiala spinifera]